MLVSCGGRNRNICKVTHREQVPQHRQKIPRLTEQSLDDASGWEYVAEGGANVVFRHRDNDTNVLRVPKSSKFIDQSKIFGFIKDTVLPTMNNYDIYSKLDDLNVSSPPKDRITDDEYYCKKNESEDYCSIKNIGGEKDKGYRLYGKLVKPKSALFLEDLNRKLCLSQRPEHRRDSSLIRSGAVEPTWLMLLPNVVGTGDICIELKPKGSLGPHNTKHPKRYDGMAMKQRTCRYCMHQEWKVHNGKIPKRRRTEKSYCPMDLFSNQKGRMKKAILALMDDPQNNCKVFRPDGKDIMPEIVASKKASSATKTTTSFEDLTGMKQDDLVDVIVEGLRESQVLDDLHRAHELDELDIERIWPLHKLVKSSFDCDELSKMKESPSLSTYPRTKGHGQSCQVDTSTRNLLSKIKCTDENNWFDIRKRYRQALEKFLLATTMKDCSILLSIRRERSLPEESKQINGKWSEMEYRIECKGAVYWILISIIDLDIKSESNLSKYYKLDHDIVHHYSETYGLHKKFCFGQRFSEIEDSQSKPHEGNDLEVQIKGNMMCRLLYPNPVCLLTVYDPTKHESNVMAITWLTAIDNHGTFVCSISKRRHTSQLLRVLSVFVLNIPTRELEDTILAIGSSTGRDTDKFRELGLQTCCPGWVSGEKNCRNGKNKDIHGATKHAIALHDCIAHTVCLVQEKQDMGQHWLMVCKQQLAWSKKAYFSDGKRFLRSSDDLPPYLTFLGTQTFGSVV